MEETVADYATQFPVKYNLLLSALEYPSLENIKIEDTFVNHICMHLILSDLLSTKDAQNLNACSALCRHFYAMFLHTKPEIICNLFQYDPNCASQNATPMERRMQFLLLEVIDIMNVLSIIHSLTRNHITSYEVPVKILQYCEEALPPDLLKQLKSVLYHHNPSKLNGHMPTEQLR